MQLDLDRLLHRAQQHACWRLNAQINKLSAKLNIWRRFKTWRNQTNNPKFCNWVNSIKSSFRASQPRVPAPALPPQPRQPRSANWQPLDLLRLCAAALCRPERFSGWQSFNQQRTLPLKCVLLAPPTNTVEEEDWICRLLSGAPLFGITYYCSRYNSKSQPKSFRGTHTRARAHTHTHI